MSAVFSAQLAELSNQKDIASGISSTVFTVVLELSFI
jgi:hypothetical protein